MNKIDELINVAKQNFWETRKLLICSIKNKKFCATQNQLRTLDTVHAFKFNLQSFAQKDPHTPH